MQKDNRQIYDSSRYISTLNENNFLQKIHTFSLLRYSASNVVNSKTKKVLLKLYQEHAYHIVSIFTHQPLCSTLAQNNLHQNTTPSSVQQKVHWLSAKRCLWKRGLND